MDSHSLQDSGSKERNEREGGKERERTPGKRKLDRASKTSEAIKNGVTCATDLPK